MNLYEKCILVWGENCMRNYFEIHYNKIKYVRQTEMYVEGFKAKLKKDTSYKGLWIVSFTLKEL